jgi:hypothetical protein
MGVLMITVTSGELRRFLEPLLLVAGDGGHIELEVWHGSLSGRATDRALLLRIDRDLSGAGRVEALCVTPADVKGLLRWLPRKKDVDVSLEWAADGIRTRTAPMLAIDPRPWPDWTPGVVLRTEAHHFKDEHDAAATWTRDIAERVGKILGYAEGIVQVRVADLVPSLITATNLTLHVAGARPSTIDPPPRGL